MCQTLVIKIQNGKCLFDVKRKNVITFKFFITLQVAEAK